MAVYDELKDPEIVFKVSERFYELIYDHPWMSLYFKDTDQEFITQQQTDFIIGAIGGPNKYSGRLPSNAHPHMNINDELFDLRKAMLVQALEELNAPEELKTIWLKIDEAFRGSIVKKSVDECKPRYAQDSILDYISNKFNKKVG